MKLIIGCLFGIMLFAGECCADLLSSLGHLHQNLEELSKLVKPVVKNSLPKKLIDVSEDLNDIDLRFEEVELNPNIYSQQDSARNKVLAMIAKRAGWNEEDIPTKWQAAKASGYQEFAVENREGLKLLNAKIEDMLKRIDDANKLKKEAELKVLKNVLQNISGAIDSVDVAKVVARKLTKSDWIGSLSSNDDWLALHLGVDMTFADKFQQARGRGHVANRKETETQWKELLKKIDQKWLEIEEAGKRPAIVKQKLSNDQERLVSELTLDKALNKSAAAYDLVAVGVIDNVEEFDTTDFSKYDDADAKKLIAMRENIQKVYAAAGEGEPKAEAEEKSKVAGPEVVEGSPKQFTVAEINTMQNRIDALKYAVKSRKIEPRQIPTNPEERKALQIKLIDEELDVLEKRGVKIDPTTRKKFYKIADKGSFMPNMGTEKLSNLYKAIEAFVKVTSQRKE